MRASIIIPTFNHAEHLAVAVDSALAQTLPCEVIVVDDGSTDGTMDVLERYWTGGPGDGSRINFHRHDENRGVAAARNTGVGASGSEFVMFLDADDVIAPTKVEEQVAALDADPGAGWAYCDVRNVFPPRPQPFWTGSQGVSVHRRRSSPPVPPPPSEVLASEMYSYTSRMLEGYLFREVAAGNFVANMAPLVRRGALLEAGPFNPSALLEDWDLLTRLACVARARYVPGVLATYRRRRNGRSDRPDPSGTHPTVRSDSPGARVLLLNLGCGTPGARSWHPLPGFVNLDRHLGWTLESGLGFFRDGTVDAVTISHVLMYLRSGQAWHDVFREVRRVLKPGGVVRVTEDDSVNPASSRYGGWRGSEPAVSDTFARSTVGYMERAGLAAREVAADETAFRDGSLRQRWHGDPPNVFFAEGVK